MRPEDAFDQVFGGGTGLSVWWVIAPLVLVALGALALAGMLWGG